MPSNNKSSIPPKLIALSYYQIAGGIIGIALTVWLILNLNSFNSLFLVIIIPSFILFLFSIFCGILLLKNKSKGLRLSLINQLLQLISFSYIGYAFQYASGLYLLIGLDITESVKFIFGIGVSSFQININTDSPIIELNFNLVALYLAIFIARIISKIKGEKEFEQVNEIGK